MDSTSERESRIVGLCVGLACPLLASVYFWWIAAAFHLYVMRMPLGMIVTAAFTGLGLGACLDVVFLRRWVRDFYAATPWVTVAVYFGLFGVLFGLFMGAPFGTFALGVATGAYVGRRQRHLHGDPARAGAAIRRAAILAASATTAAALPIGILAVLGEQQLLNEIEDCLRLKRNCLTGAGGFLLVGVLCVVLFATQFWCARTAGRLAFQIGSRPSSPRS